ncbi:glycosyltransferase [Paenarthrobacter sp. Z7-10]|uniref:glycosyltransferase n=1 Tax=Paenarthrobacter sp. Z7-10 TaxID=2787635 RepID=UPI0022A9294D|nr:glycosyltransferase [Paenarthrobacter sp. Z7-10]MCZ2403926.1 glycosyltransferase [Paenarthrobacter sp. Z7-10]
MKVALTKSTLLVPPTYFAINHARQMCDEHEFRFFTLAAKLADSDLGVPVQDFVPFRKANFTDREKFIPLFMPVMSAAIARFQPDIIHQHFATWSWPAVRASKGRGFPLLTTIHGSDVVVAGRPAATAMARWHHRNIRLAQEQSSRILAVSTYLADLAVVAGFPAKKIQVHYQGIDTEFFEPGPEGETDDSAPSDGPPRILFVGSINQQKGILDLVQASKQLVKRVEHELVVIGSGPLESVVRKEIEGSTHISLLSQLDRVSVRNWMRRATVLVAPSQEYRGAREAAGLVLLEAQACGTPVVAYQSGGTGEMVDPVSGGLVPEGDVPALRGRVEEALNLSDRDQMSMSGAARSFVLRERSLALSCEELGRHYDEVAQGRQKN